MTTISTIEQFRTLGDEWNALLAQNRDHELSFQSHHWLECWLAAYHSAGTAPTGRITIVTARMGDQLRAIAPLYAYARLGLTRLTWLGNPTTQYGDVLTDGSQEATQLIGPMIDHAVMETSPDILNLCKVRDDAAIMPWLRHSGSVAMKTDAAPFLDFSSAA